MTSADVSLSRLPVGSSAHTMAGSLTKARATLTRCCCPPDISAGRLCPSPARPTISSACSAARRASDERHSGDEQRQFHILQPRSSTGSRLNSWNTNPMRCCPVASPLLVGHRVQCPSLDEHLAGSKIIEPGESVQQSGLPAARRAHHGHHLATRYAQVDAPQSSHLQPPGLIHLVYADRLDDRLGRPFHIQTNVTHRRSSSVASSTSGPTRRAGL